MTLENAFGGLALDDTLRRRYGDPGTPKLPACAAYTTAGDHTLITPTAGKRLRVFFVQAIPSSDNEFANGIIFKFNGGAPFYQSYALGHWEMFEGAVNQTLVVNTENAGKVLITVHYEEF